MVSRFACSIAAVCASIVVGAQSLDAQRTSTTGSPSTATANPANADPVRLALGSGGNEARFIVHERLMSHEMDNDAIGRTTHISGVLTLAPDGTVDSANSMFTVGLESLTSDKANRDSWIKGHTLKTDSFPTARLVVTSIEGLPGPLPTSGTFNVSVVGNLTIHGVTRPSTWSTWITANGNEYTGSAVTHITFEDFGMEQPRLMIVLSVVDDITLQYDFHLVRL